MKTKPDYLVQAEGMQARFLLGRLKECKQSGSRYLDREMEAAKVKIEFRPDFKEVLREVSSTLQETMADFVRTATQERMERILGQRITEGEAVMLATAAKDEAA